MTTTSADPPLKCPLPIGRAHSSLLAAALIRVRTLWLLELNGMWHRTWYISTLGGLCAVLSKSGRTLTHYTDHIQMEVSAAVVSICSRIRRLSPMQVYVSGDIFSADLSVGSVVGSSLARSDCHDSCRSDAVVSTSSTATAEEVTYLVNN